MKKLALTLSLASTAFAFNSTAHAATTEKVVSVATAPPMGYHAAPSVIVSAAPVEKYKHCGLFETCSTTKKGLGKGDILIKFQAMGLITNNTSSSVDMENSTLAPVAGGLTQGQVAAAAKVAPDGNALHALRGAQGNVTMDDTVMPGFTFQYFVTDHISVDAIASAFRLHARADNTALGRLGGLPQNIVNGAFGAGASNGNGNVDLGSTWVIPPTLTVAWHFRPHKRFNPYAGVGLMLAFFFNEQPGGKHGGGSNNGNGNCNVNSNSCGPITRLHAQTTPGVAFDFGFDYQVVGNWFFNMDVKQALLHVPVSLNGKGTGIANQITGKIRADDSVNPTVLATGIGYRF